MRRAAAASLTSLSLVSPGNSPRRRGGTPRSTCVFAEKFGRRKTGQHCLTRVYLRKRAHAPHSAAPMVALNRARWAVRVCSQYFKGVLRRLVAHAHSTRTTATNHGSQRRVPIRPRALCTRCTSRLWSSTFPSSASARTARRRRGGPVSVSFAVGGSARVALAGAGSAARGRAAALCVLVGNGDTGGAARLPRGARGGGGGRAVATSARGPGQRQRTSELRHAPKDRGRAGRRRGARAARNGSRRACPSSASARTRGDASTRHSILCRRRQRTGALQRASSAAR